ncbi:hypothetical protein ACFYW9_19200 [Streptomyces sp. NPDC002698]|uniref:hypothetical protein n=1 Tax=Streptomyces sp. NPDC002698 TaxID=3364660 RepID=UPI00369D425E
MTPTQQDTYDHIFGSSFDIHSWWGPVRPDWDRREDAPHGWHVMVPVLDGDSDWRNVMVTHSMILGAMGRLAEGDVKYATDSVELECREFLKDPENADFDAATADEVMQMVTLGEIVYG